MKKEQLQRGEMNTFEISHVDCDFILCSTLQHKLHNIKSSIAYDTLYKIKQNI